tara:strand:+ start:18 stop:422 length:405 start_codon:yes stop_codon:yes gene_type:complete
LSLFSIGVDELVGTNKKLQEKSIYEDLDYNKDGVVSDKELQTHHKIMEARQEELKLANQDARDDQQRRMVWVSLLSVCVAVAIIFLPFIAESRLIIIIPFLQVWSITNLGIVATFMATSAWSKRNGSEKQQTKI